MRALRPAVLTVLALLPVLAHAAPRDDARRSFVRGLQAAEQGDYRSALEAFLAAEALYSHPATMYNIARAYEDLGQPEDALPWYDRLVRDHPDRAGDASERATRIRAQVAPQAPAPARPAPQTAPTQVTTITAPSASQEELTRLQRLARELESLTTELLERPPPEPVVVETPAPPQPPPGVTDDGAQDPDAPAAEPPPTVVAEAPRPTPPSDAGEGFLTDAYERTVTSATRSGQDPLDSPSSITVITADDIRRSGATNFWDLLRRVPGVEVMSMSSSTPYLGIRGFNSELTNKVLWLVDGRPVYFELLAAPLPLGIPVGLEDVERIEVIRGPGSALYGANAVTGVVNILTKQPGEGESAQMSLSGGAPGFTYASASASGRTGDLGYRFSAGYEQEGRWEKEGEFGSNDPVVPFFDNQDIAGQRFRAMGKLQYNFLDQGLASIEGGLARGRTELYNIGALGNYGLDGQTTYARADIGYGPVRLRSYWNREEGDLGPWLARPGGTRDLNARVNNDVFDVEAEATLPFTTGPVSHLLNVGAGYRYKIFRFGYLEGGFDNPFVEHHASAFVQETLSWDWLTSVLSFRLDRHPLVDISKTLSPRGALIFRVAPRTSIRINGGTAFRAMNAVESYMDLALDTTADGFFVRDLGGIIRRPTTKQPTGIEPERIFTVEVGARDESSVFHIADVTLYWNRVSRLIGLEPVEQVILPFDADRGGLPFGLSGFTNTAEIYDAFGGEAELTVFPVDGLDVFANLAINRIIERAPDGTSVVDGSSSLVKVNVGASYRAPFRMDFTVNGHYLSAQAWRLREFDGVGDLVINIRQIPGRFLLSARVAGRPLPKRDLELSVSLWNPLGFNPDARFREHPKGQLVGPRIFGNISFRL